MNAKQITKTICILIVSLLIASCGPGQPFGPTPTPIPLVPKAGNWEGGDLSELGYKVYLVVSPAGRLLELTLVRDFQGTICPRTWSAYYTDDRPNGFSVNSDGTFYDYDDGGQEGIRGSFNTTETASGIVTERYCRGDIFSPSNNYDVEWSAKWVSDK